MTDLIQQLAVVVLAFGLFVALALSLAYSRPGGDT